MSRKKIVELTEEQKANVAKYEAEKKARQEEAERKNAEREANHQADLANWIAKTEYRGDDSYERMSFKAVGAESGREIWALDIEVTRSKRWSSKEEEPKWQPWEISTSGTHRSLVEARIYNHLLKLAIEFVERHS